MANIKGEKLIGSSYYVKRGLRSGVIFERIFLVAQQESSVPLRCIA